MKDVTRRGFITATLGSIAAASGMLTAKHQKTREEEPSLETPPEVPAPEKRREEPGKAIRHDSICRRYYEWRDNRHGGGLVLVSHEYFEVPQGSYDLPAAMGQVGSIVINGRGEWLVTGINVEDNGIVKDIGINYRDVTGTDLSLLTNRTNLHDRAIQRG